MITPFIICQYLSEVQVQGVPDQLSNLAVELCGLELEGRDSDEFLGRLGLSVLDGLSVDIGGETLLRQVLVGQSGGVEHVREVPVSLAIQ